MKPLFIPLKTEYFEAFRDGRKATEFRIYGPRWNERTCVPGRGVVLSKGYGKRERLNGWIVSFRSSTVYGLEQHAREAFLECYGREDVDVARILIRIDRPSPGGVK
jgi:hypothetical protein